jgi:CheY-like chemotaxis protein
LLSIENEPVTWKEDSLVNKIAARKPANRNSALPKPKWKILLVGDYPSSQKVRAEILEEQGYVVDTVRDADEARARWQPNPYDLVLVDGERNPRARIKFCQEIGKVASARQQVAVLVGYSAPAITVSAATLIPKDEDPKYFVDRMRRLFREVAQREVSLLSVPQDCSCRNLFYSRGRWPIPISHYLFGRTERDQEPGWQPENVCDRTFLGCF